MSKHYYAAGAHHDDQHKEFHINAPMKGDDILKLASRFFADDVEDAEVVEETSPEIIRKEENAESRQEAGETKLFRTDKCVLEDCKKQLDNIIATSRTKTTAAKRIYSAGEGFLINTGAFTHEEMAKALNDYQKKFEFKKTDIDSVTRSRS